MSRKKSLVSLQRDISPDRRYNSVLVQKLINKSMLDGKKTLAQRMVYEALEKAAKNVKADKPAEVFEKALFNISPSFEVKSRRVGGANFQIPFPIQGHRQMHFAYVWLIEAARARSGMSFADALSAEITDAYKETGAAFKKKEDTHRMAEANRAYAHFAKGMN